MGRQITTYSAEGGIATLTLTNAPVNALHPEVTMSMIEGCRKAHADPSIKAIILTGDGKDFFCAGFDIGQFAKVNAGENMSNAIPSDWNMNDVLSEHLERGPKPTVAALNGTALGGGCELAMACNARVGHAGLVVGLPELTLGILPGFGGTQRLPRLVGLEAGLEAILTSKPIPAAKAAKLGFFDVPLVPKGEVMAAARRLALDLANGTAPRHESLKRVDKLPADPQRSIALIDAARARSLKVSPNLLHPLYTLDAIRVGVLEGGIPGLRAEEDAFAKSIALSTHKSLVHIFFSTRGIKKVKGVTDAGLKPRPIKKLAVVGGGLMGSGIATASIFAGITVLLKEINQQFLDAGVGRVRANVLSGVKKGRYTQAKADATLSLLKPTLTYDGWKDVDLVIEAAVEVPELKQKIFKELHDATGPNTILTTNTSTINIDVVGKLLPESDRGRLAGAHFFSPAHVMPLLEIVRSKSTSPQTVIDLMSYGSKIKKSPVVVGNCAGFAVNRVFFPYHQSAMILVDAGVSPYVIDKAIKDFGMPMGPFRLSDLVGGDIGYFGGPTYVNAFPERVYRGHLTSLLFHAGILGEKTGSGYYTFDAKRNATPNPKIEHWIEESRSRQGFTQVHRDVAKAIAADPQKIVEFIFFTVVNEACRVIAEGIVDKPADLDVATILSMGFPAYRGGVVFWADLIGADKIHDSLASWSRTFADKGLAEYFYPSQLLRDVAAKKGKISAGASRGSL